MQFVYTKYAFYSSDIIPVNTGGESLTHIYHIIRNYDVLPSVVIFTQVGRKPGRKQLCAC